MRKQANRGRKDQRRRKNEEETHHEISVTVDRTFSIGRQKKPLQDFPVEASEQFLQESLKKRAAKGEIGRDFS